MVSARNAREWAANGGLHGIGDSMYTPFNGAWGDDIDWDAYRTLIRYCVGPLGHQMLWLTSGVAEWWALTLDERKKLLEVAVAEARAINPDIVIQACTVANCAKETLELTQHAQEAGADICFIQTPTMEVHAGEGVLRFFEYVAERSDIALGMFNSNASGYVMTAQEMAEIYQRVPAVVAVKEGVMDSFMASAALHNLAPGLQIWECDLMVYRAGWMEQGIVTPAQLGNVCYLYETPEKKWYTQYWELMWEGRIKDAIAFSVESGLEEFLAGFSPHVGGYHGRPGYMTHWGEPIKIAAQAVGLPVGNHLHARPPQALFPDSRKAAIPVFFEKYGLGGGATPHVAKIQADLRNQSALEAAE